MKKIISVFITLVLSAMMAVPAFAAPAQDDASKVSSFVFAPVAPGAVPFSYNLTPGSKVSDSLRMYNNTSEEMTFRLQVAPFENDKSTEWLQLSAESVTVPANSYQDVKYTIAVAETDPVGTKYAASLTAISMEAGDTSEVSGDKVGARVNVALGYGVVVNVNVYNGEPVVSEEAPSEGGAYAFLVNNLNTILLVLVVLIMLKVAVDVSKKKK